MILQMPWGGERVNTIRKNQPEWPQHILNYSWIDGHASWAFLPKRSQFFFWGPTGPPAPTLCSASPSCHPLACMCLISRGFRSESRTGGRLVSPAGGREKKIEHSLIWLQKSFIIILSFIRTVVWYQKLKIQWGTKPFKCLLRLDCFLNNSGTTQPNMFKFCTKIDYYVINKFQFVLLHNLDLFPCY